MLQFKPLLAMIGLPDQILCVFLLKHPILPSHNLDLDIQIQNSKRKVTNLHKHIIKMKAESIALM